MTAAPTTFAFCPTAQRGRHWQQRLVPRRRPAQNPNTIGIKNNSTFPFTGNRFPEKVSSVRGAKSLTNTKEINMTPTQKAAVMKNDATLEVMDVQSLGGGKKLVTFAINGNTSGFANGDCDGGDCIYLFDTSTFGELVDVSTVKLSLPEWGGDEQDVPAAIFFCSRHIKKGELAPLDKGAYLHHVETLLKKSPAAVLISEGGHE